MAARVGPSAAFTHGGRLPTRAAPTRAEAARSRSLCLSDIVACVAGPVRWTGCPRGKGATLGMRRRRCVPIHFCQKRRPAFWSVELFTRLRYLLNPGLGSDNDDMSQVTICPYGLIAKLRADSDEKKKRLRRSAIRLTGTAPRLQVWLGTTVAKRRGSIATGRQATGPWVPSCTETGVRRDARANPASIHGARYHRRPARRDTRAEAFSSSRCCV